MRISEKQYKSMPPHLQELFAKLPNYGSQQVMELFPQSSITGKRRDPMKSYHQHEGGEWFGRKNHNGQEYLDSGSAARFFYCAKSSKGERGEDNNHPTVKPLALMEYLVKLVKMPEYNLIIDPFMGSGTTLLACIRLGIPCIGIDNDEKSCEIAAKRCTQGVFDLSEVK